MLENAKGTRDFSPEEKIARDYVINTFKVICERFGFNPIETPIIEKYETLAAKFAAGESSDAMTEIFRFSDQGKRKLGLRFDLTVPFSRYVAMDRSIKMPFKKYMTGEVFRDGPIKKGRYRQFTQFDVDIVGTENMIADAEILAYAQSVFDEFGFDIVIQINNRKILDGLLTDVGIKKNKWFDVTVSIDKLKKIGSDGVIAELVEKGFDEANMKEVLSSLTPEKTNQRTLDKLKEVVSSEIAKQGIKEMQDLLDFVASYGVKVQFDPTLARGLAYYTGPIFEVFLKDSSITSSIAGGGRYDELIGNYMGSDEGVPATGISFGVDVILEALRDMGKLKQNSAVQIYVIPIKADALPIVKKLRDAGINTDVDLMSRSISKNLQYADSYGIPYVLFVGQRELDAGKLKLRDMKSGEEQSISLNDLSKLSTIISS